MFGTEKISGKSGERSSEKNGEKSGGGRSKEKKNAEIRTGRTGWTEKQPDKQPDENNAKKTWRKNKNFVATLQLKLCL